MNAYLTSEERRELARAISDCASVLRSSGPSFTDVVALVERMIADRLVAP